MENNILDNNGDIKLNVSGYLKVYHNGELVEEHKNDIAPGLKSLIAEHCVGKTMSVFIGSEGFVKFKSPSTTVELELNDTELNQNRLGGDSPTTPSVTGKFGILISKEQATVAANNNVIHAMKTSFEQTTGVNTFKIIGEFTKTGSTQTYNGAAFGLTIRDLADGSSTPYSLVHLPNPNANTSRINVPLAYNNSLNRTLNAGDTLRIEWTITIN